MEVNRYTLADYAEQAGLKGVKMQTIETIVDCEPLFATAPMLPCNNGTFNITEVNTVYPKGQTRGYNQGVAAEKTGSKMVQDNTCMISTYNEIDKKIVQNNGNSAEWRARKDKAFVRGLSHSVAERLFNASLKRDPNEFDGFATRYNKINDCVINAGGTTGSNNLTDIWLINWGVDTAHLIYPESGVAGLQQYFDPDVDAYDKDGKLFKADRTRFEWDIGLAIPDYMQVIRIANVDVAKATAGEIKLIDLLTEATERLPGDANAGAMFYMNRELRTALRLQISAKPNVNLTWEGAEGKKVLNWDGIAIHKTVKSVIPMYSTALK